MSYKDAAVCGPTSAALGTGGNGSGFTVLVAADDYDTMAGLATALHFSGHEVRVAQDRLTALRVAHEVRPDVVLLALPDVDRLYLADRLREDPRHETSLIVACGKSDDPVARLRSYLAGIDVHFLAPLDFGELRAVLLRFWAGARKEAVRRPFSSFNSHAHISRPHISRHRIAR